MDYNKQKLSLVKSYLWQHWHKILLGSIVLFMILSKDFSFSINLNSPDAPAKIDPHIQVPVNKDRKTKRTVLTDDLQADAQRPKEQKSSLFDAFRWPFIGKGSVSNDKSEWANVDRATQLAYIDRFAQVAQNEQKKFGIPSSLILANAMFHSFAGQRTISQSANNHFGLACNEWTGERKTEKNTCYRAYESAWMSYRDHSQFLTTGDYAPLTQLSATDYQTWARGLEKLGYSEFPDLAKELTSIIQEFELDRFDR